MEPDRPPSLSPRHRGRAAATAVELLSSMRFAISLLTLLCMASVIGTVLKQHEPVVNYVNQFGPFWSAVFMALKLHAVYSAGWFLLILAFLVTSTSLCIARNAPKIVADLRTYKENIREQSLLAFHHKAQAPLAEPPVVAAARIGGQLAAAGWKVRLQRRAGPEGDGWMVAAKVGAANKLGYLAAHSAIVLICLGGLLDGDLIVRAQMLLGDKTAYRGGGLMADVPAAHRLPATNPTFRANLLVTEGTQAATALINQSDGVVLQELPFSIELKKFIVEYYSSGMPKRFASDILIHDPSLAQPVAATVEVNHPVRHRGIEIYQSSFDDGGSQVRLQALPLDAALQPFEVQGTVGGSTPLAAGQAGSQPLTLEFTGLRVINVENLANEADLPAAGGLRAALDARLGAANKTVTHKTLRNVGPSVSYKLRDAAGQAREFNNYMLPVDLGDGVPVFLWGTREATAEAFRYLRLPVDSQGGIGELLRLRAALADRTLRAQAARRYAQRATLTARPEVTAQLAAASQRALDVFAGADLSTGREQPAAGLRGVSEFIEANVPQAERPRAGEMLLRILDGSLLELAQLVRERSGQPAWPEEPHTRAFMTQALLALSDLNAYPAAVVLKLQDFKQVQASVFQLTRAPGHYLVYLGCALLIAGVFAMLYVRERRLWVWLAPQAKGSAARMALSCNRKILDVDREFAQLKDQLLKAAPP